MGTEKENFRIDPKIVIAIIPIGIIGLMLLMMQSAVAKPNFEVTGARVEDRYIFGTYVVLSLRNSGNRDAYNIKIGLTQLIIASDTGEARALSPVGAELAFLQGGQGKQVSVYIGGVSYLVSGKFDWSGNLRVKEMKVSITCDEGVSQELLYKGP